MLILRDKKQAKFGQVIIEFTFSMIIVFLMIYSITKIFEWTGREIVDRRLNHDSVLKTTNVRAYTTIAESEQIAQISPFFSSGTPMNAIWDN